MSTIVEYVVKIGGPVHFEIIDFWGEGPLKKKEKKQQQKIGLMLARASGRQCNYCGRTMCLFHRWNGDLLANKRV